MILTDVTNQTLYLAVALFCGIISGVYYDILYAVKKLALGGKIMEFVFDFIFFALSILTVLYFFYLVNGFDIKWYMFLGYFAGFCLERLTFKNPVANITEKVYNKTTKIIKEKFIVFINLRKKHSKKTEATDKNDGKTIV